MAASVRVGYIPVLGSSALFVLDGKGWAKDAGIDLELVRFSSGPQAIQALVSGRIDAYVAGILPLLQVRSHGTDVKVMATGAIEELSVVARGAFAAGIPQDGPSAEPLAGRIAAFTKAQGRRLRIAAQPEGSVPDTLLRFWLTQKEKQDISSVEIVGLGIDAAQQAFLAGAVDAAVLREPALTVIRSRLPETRTLATGHDMLPDQPGSVLAILRPSSPEHAAWAAKLTGLFVKATAFVSAHPDEAAPYVSKELGAGLLGPDVIARALRASADGFVSDPARIVAGTKALQDFEVSRGLLRSAAPVEDLFDLVTWRQAAP
ncbi:ABC transporter substrate-binding protein [Acetobacter sp. AN02]|nr:ABC transporter substrate-binding protein [Acetobacter sp. AN02]MDG6093559.1 ABC transporter substrate-binding protein [Acetobacter sp. AN02]